MIVPPDCGRGTVYTHTAAEKQLLVSASNKLGCLLCKDYEFLCTIASRCITKRKILLMLTIYHHYGILIVAFDRKIKTVFSKYFNFD